MVVPGAGSRENGEVSFKRHKTQIMQMNKF